MGVFDVALQRSLKADDKNKILDYFQNELKPRSKEPIAPNKEGFTLEKFREKKSLMQYNLSVSVTPTKEGHLLSIEGELQNLWIIVVFIALGVLFTYGVGLVVVIAFVYFQKVVATNYFNALIDRFKS
ncbi:MAG: hypothetical protein ACNI3C_03230 [Candidatus Marinarcus sp.]|uniref:hypothetical protein n=1 Tax=Candidatus Marinarcus sp. TaxID=3100987 RepID=UPI003AFF87CE